MKTFLCKYKTECLSGIIVMPFGIGLLMYITSLHYSIYNYGFWLITSILLLSSLLLASLLYVFLYRQGINDRG